MVPNGIFPITEREAAVLHDLKWSSGFGWRSEWDWWQGDDHETANSDETRLKLVHHVVTIRAAVASAETLAKDMINNLE